MQEDDRWERSSCSNGEYRTYTVTPRGHGNQSYSPNLARHQIRRRHHSQTSSPSRQLINSNSHLRNHLHISVI